MILENVNLREFTTFGVNANTRFFSTFKSVEELTELLKNNSDKSFFVLGGGSNILFTSQLDSLTLKNEIVGIDIVHENENSVILKVGAGEVWHDFVLYCIQNSYYGVENLSLIPGSVGACPIQNIGAYGVEVKHVIYRVEAFEIETGKLVHFSNEECKFGYRESIFKNTIKGKYIIVSVYFKLYKNGTINIQYGAIKEELTKKGILSPTLLDVSNAVISIRQSKLPNPKELGNAGSFFKNPIVSQDLYDAILKNYPEAPSFPAEEGMVKIPAGWLIENTGWKGKRKGNCGVHVNQALVLVNYGDASGQEILELSQNIMDDVFSKFKVILEREVNIV